MRIDDGAPPPHRFASPRDYYHSLYFQACDLLLRELEDRFDQKELLPLVLALENLIVKAANGEGYDDALQSVEESCFAGDIHFDSLRRHLSLVCDLVKEAIPGVHKVTSIHTVCDAMNMSNAYKSMLSEVHKLLRLYLTVPIASSTSEQTFSAMKRLLTYLRSTMTEKRLNNCILLHVHKDLTDQLNITDIAKEFISANSDCHRYFGSFLA